MPHPNATPTRQLATVTLVLGLWLGVGACDTTDHPAQPPVLEQRRTSGVETQVPDPYISKSRRGGSGFVAHPRRFVSGLRVAALAITPRRMLATTIGHADAKVVTIDESGAFEAFSTFQAPAEAHCDLVIASGIDARFPQGEAFVAHAMNVWSLNRDGTQTQLEVTLPAVTGAITGLCFDDTGEFGFALLLMTQSGSVYTYDRDELPRSIGSVGTGGRAPSVAATASGAHAGRLLVSFPEVDEVRALDADGVLHLVTRWSGVAGACTVPQSVREFGDSRGALFVAVESGEIYAFPAGPLGPLAGDLLLTSMHASGSGVAKPVGAGYTWRAFNRFVGAENCAAFVRQPAITPVEIAVDPTAQAAPPAIQRGSTALLPVAILSAPDFAPNEIDPASVRCASAASVPAGRHGFGTLVDLNQDARLDLILHFRPSEMSLGPGDASLSLQGTTFADEAFRGRATVQVHGP